MSDSRESMLGAAGLGRRAFLGLAAGFVLLVSGGAGLAQPRRRRRRLRRMRRRALRRFRRRGGGRMHEQARAAVQRGEIRPFRDVVAKVRTRSNAEILDVDLHKRGGGWIYALRVMTPQGRVQDVFLDARTLDVLHLGDSLGDEGVPLPKDFPGDGPARREIDVPPPPERRD